MKKKLKLSLLALLWPIVSLFAQMQISPEGLQIGDKLPEEIWHLPLQVVNHPEGKETITLNDYKGKLIILDFWATWCGACVKNMPMMHGLQEHFKNDIIMLPVTRQPAGKIQGFLKNNHLLKSLEMLSVVEDTLLRHFFPSKTIPHVIVIDAKGRVSAITSPVYVNKKAISALLEQKKAHIVRKRERADTPLLAVTGPYAPQAQTVYYSAVTGWLDGFTGIGNTVTDTLKGTKRSYLINCPLLSLYSIALPDNRGIVHLPNRRVLEVSDPSRYLVPRDGDNLQWSRENMYCYEAVVPASWSTDRIKKKMKQDLDMHFNLYGRIETRPTSCWVVTLEDPGKLPLTEGGKKAIVLSGRRKSGYGGYEPVTAKKGKRSYVRNTKIRGWVYRMNRLPGVPPFFDETGVADKVDLDLPDDIADFKALKKALGRYGLLLESEIRDLTTFILTEREDNGLEKKNASL